MNDNQARELLSLLTEIRDSQREIIDLLEQVDRSLDSVRLEIGQVRDTIESPA
jgi:hypothetical protein